MDWLAILAGGGGTRLWPLSRRRRPKQFLPLLPGGETLLGATARRAAAVASPERTLVVTAASQVEEVRRAVPHLPAENVVVEPVGRNTAPCIGLAAVEVLRRDPDAVLGVLPSDQHVLDEPRFADALRRALDAAGGGRVVAIGIRPTGPETGFGYLQLGPAQPGGGPRPVARFIEKPDRAAAERYLADGGFLWNAGMFFFPAARLLEEIRALLPALGGILDGIGRDPSRKAALYPMAQVISIDYAVMEKLPGSARGLWVVEGEFGWSDVGSFASLPCSEDAAGNTILGEALALDSRENVLVSSGPLIAVLGIQGLVVVATGDAVLVMPAARAQEVRRVVEELATGGRDPYL